MSLLDDILRELAELFRRLVAPADAPGASSRGDTMNGFTFTERVRKVLARSREEAKRLNHQYVGTEHILLGIVAESEGVAAAVLRALAADPVRIRQRVEEIVRAGAAPERVRADLLYTSRAKKVLELAMTSARDLEHSYVGTEHLLLGLLREEQGVAAQVLVEAGVTLERARATTIGILLDAHTPSTSKETGPAAAPGSKETGPTAAPNAGPAQRALGRRPRPVASAGTLDPGWYFVPGDAGRAKLDDTVVAQLADAQLLSRLASARRMQSDAERMEEETLWLRIRGLIDLCERMETPVRLEVGGDCGLTLVIAERVRVPVPNSASRSGGPAAK